MHVPSINRGAIRTTASDVIHDSFPVRIRSGAQWFIESGRSETIAALHGTGTLTFEGSTCGLLIGSRSTIAGAVVMHGTEAIIEPSDGSRPGQLTFTGSMPQGFRLRGGAVRIRIRNILEHSSLKIPATELVISDPANGYAGTVMAVTLDGEPENGDVLKIVDVGGSTPVRGHFSVPEGNGTRVTALYNGQRYGFDILYNTSEGGGDGNDIALACTGRIPCGTEVIIG